MKRCAVVTGVLAGTLAVSAPAHALDCTGSGTARTNGLLIVSRAPYGIGHAGGLGLYTIRRNGSGLRRLTRPGPQAIDGFSNSVSASPDGRVAFVRTGRRPRMKIVSLKTRRTRSLLPGVDVFSFASPSWSPDGEWIAFSDATRTQLVHPNGTGLHELPAGSRLPNQVTWSRNGRCLVGYASGPGDDRPYIGVVGVEGGEPAAFRAPMAQAFGMQFSPDGTHILFAGTRNRFSNRRSGIFSVNLDGTGLHKIAGGTRGAADEFAISPDGRWLAYSDPKGTMIRRLAGGPPRRLFRGLYIKVWAARPG
jgi:Tol biopolymer transport system component